MKYWVILEFHNGTLNSLRGPYASQMDAIDHLDKCKAWRKANPVPLSITWDYMPVYQPEHVK